MVKITYDEFKNEELFQGDLKELDNAILKALKSNAMELKDIASEVKEYAQKTNTIMPYTFKVSQRLAILRKKGKVLLKKIGNKYFWGLNK